MPTASRGVGRPDRPRERLVRLGAHALSDAELIALVLRTGRRGADALATASSLLARFDGLDALLDLTGSELERMVGLGEVKSASLQAALEIARRIPRSRVERGKPIGAPIDVHRHFLPRLGRASRESFHVLLLDGRHRLIAERQISVGTLTASLVHPREVFRDAIRSAAAALVVAHNHPSGDPTPSSEDRAVTERLCAAGELVGIRVVDHVIVAMEGHFSFREAGLLCDRASRSQMSDGPCGSESFPELDARSSTPSSVPKGILPESP